jgi:hypothetical protein
VRETCKAVEQGALAVVPAQGREIAPALSCRVAALLKPDDEIAEDADGTVRVVVLPAPSEHDADFALGIGVQRREGEGVIGIPNLKLTGHFHWPKIDSDDAYLGVGKTEASGCPFSIAGSPCEPQHTIDANTAKVRVLGRGIEKAQPVIVVGSLGTQWVLRLF